MYDNTILDFLAQLQNVPTTLTLEEWNRVKDEVEYQCFPHEYWYLVHSDDLEKVRAAFFEVRWGTCPCIKVSEFSLPGKVLKVRVNPTMNWGPSWSK